MNAYCKKSRKLHRNTITRREKILSEILSAYSIVLKIKVLFATQIYVYGTNLIFVSHTPKLAQPALLIKLLFRTPLVEKLSVTFLKPEALSVVPARAAHYRMFDVARIYLRFAPA